MADKQREDRRQSSPELRRSILAYAKDLDKAHQLAGESLRHDDRMLTWIIGLVGAAIFALPDFVTAMCGSSTLRSVAGIRAVIGAWIAAIVLGLLGRIIGAAHRDADNLFFLTKWSALRSYVVGPGDKPEAVRDAMADLGEVGKRKETTRRFGRSFVWLYYPTMGLAAVGAALLFSTILTCK